MKPKDVKDIITMTSHPTFLFIVTTDYYKKTQKTFLNTCAVSWQQRFLQSP